MLSSLTLPSPLYLCALPGICTSFSVVPFGNNGCNGGDTYSVFEYIIANGGVDTASYYPYKARVSVANIHVYSNQCQCN